jgi:hypothetical protein
VKRDLDALGMNGARELARLARASEKNLSGVLTSQVKRNAAESQLQRTREFERRRAAQPPLGQARREANRQRNGAHFAEKQRQIAMRIEAMKERREDKEGRVHDTKASRAEELTEKRAEARAFEAERAADVACAAGKERAVRAAEVGCRA